MGKISFIIISMQAKGDIRANFEKLKTDLRSIKYLNPLE